ncbi:NAD(P)/FAD-dependent oxidoreductase [Phanerochaete sordida]|uniref:NAD(P)/FAD-dependent oxidoreductase n=1 Tax=Phanerochaete sordida TaxID=48140 RepID=A0A9P3FXH4_9APHY|nr:NAD(P)/FAD-dependent oxidoreductase [Phanerochaete sordida]
MLNALRSLASFLPSAPAPQDQLSDTHAEDTSPPFSLGDFPIDAPRPLKVVVIGAGFSGIAAGIRFLQRVPNVELTIYEKNGGIGGAWWSNRYPGLACDIPSHCYQYTFFPNTQWSAFYAPGSEILAYLQTVVSTYDLEKYIKLEHEMVGAKWDEATGRWRVNIKRPRTKAEGAEVFEDTADLLFTGVGSLSRWNWPDIEGLGSFKGSLIHSAKWEVPSPADATASSPQIRPNWEEDVKDWGNKRVAVIGVGSSAIQIVPALQKKVGRVLNFVRGKTWLALPFAGGKMAELLHRDPTSENYVFSEEEKASFRDNDYYKQFRHDLEADLNSVHQGTLKDSDMQKGARAAFRANMLERLTKKPWIADHLIPDFGVACRRLTPGPGYLEALCEDNVDFVPTAIKRITEAGIETIDGQQYEVDVIICATGYDTSYTYPFQMVGRNGVRLADKWAPHPRSYLSICVDDFPNWFFSLGPNAGVGSGSLLALMEYQVDYAVHAARKMQREGLKTIEIKKEAVDDYDEYIEHYFPTTVYSEKCRSWYKMGKEEGRIVGLWPGSCLHALVSLKDPRWEDFSYSRRDGSKNRLRWLGNGMTHSEQYMTGDRAWYLNDENVDIPPVPLEVE